MSFLGRDHMINFYNIKFDPSMHFIWDSLWVSIEAVILCSPVLFQCRYVKQSFKGKSFSNKENNSKPTPDNVRIENSKAKNWYPIDNKVIMDEKEQNIICSAVDEKIKHVGRGCWLFPFHSPRISSGLMCLKDAPTGGIWHISYPRLWPRWC